jgi:hypothetical protein
MILFVRPRAFAAVMRFGVRKLATFLEMPGGVAGHP